MPRPVNAAEIVSHRNLCGRGKIGHAHDRAGQPCTVVNQVIDIIEMPVGQLHGFTQYFGLRRLPVDQTLFHPFVQKRLRHIAIKLFVKPRDQPACFGAILRSARDHRIGGNGFIDIF